MSLLPIIYTSLMITGGFLIFVIIVSYISYRVKNGERKKISTAKNKNLEFSLQAAAHPVQKKTVTITEPSLKKQNTHHQFAAKTPTPKVIMYKHPHSERLVNTKPEMRKRRVENKKQEINLHETKPDFMKKSAAGKLRNRIEVINPNQNFNRPTNELSAKQTNSSSAKYLSGNDVLDYYGDGQTDYFLLKSAGLASG